MEVNPFENGHTHRDNFPVVSDDTLFNIECENDENEPSEAHEWSIEELAHLFPCKIHETSHTPVPYKPRYTPSNWDDSDISSFADSDISILSDDDGPPNSIHSTPWKGQSPKLPSQMACFSPIAPSPAMERHLMGRCHSDSTLNQLWAQEEPTSPRISRSTGALSRSPRTRRATGRTAAAARLSGTAVRLSPATAGSPSPANASAVDAEASPTHAKAHAKHGQRTTAGHRSAPHVRRGSLRTPRLTRHASDLHMAGSRHLVRSGSDLELNGKRHLVARSDAYQQVGRKQGISKSRPRRGSSLRMNGEPRERMLSESNGGGRRSSGMSGRASLVAKRNRTSTASSRLASSSSETYEEVLDTLTHLYISRKLSQSLSPRTRATSKPRTADEPEMIVTSPLCTYDKPPVKRVLF